MLKISIRQWKKQLRCGRRVFSGMSLEDLKGFMGMLSSRVNESEDLQNTVARWVGKQMGKILQVEAEGEIFHVIITPKKMKVKMGPYPSPDVIYRAEKAETLMDIFSGRVDFRSVIKDWSLVVVGSGHESIPLSELILEVLMSM